MDTASILIPTALGTAAVADARAVGRAVAPAAAAGGGGTMLGTTGAGAAEGGRSSAAAGGGGAASRGSVSGST